MHQASSIPQTIGEAAARDRVSADFDYPVDPKWITCICGCLEKRHFGTPEQPLMNYGSCRDCECPELYIQGSWECVQAAKNQGGKPIPFDSVLSSNSEPPPVFGQKVRYLG